MITTIEKNLKLKSNNYGKLEKKFRESAGCALLDSNGRAPNPRISCSVIIPFNGESSALKYTLAALCSQNIERHFKRSKVEIIIVNDGSKEDINKILIETSKFYPVKYIIFNKSHGRAFARNAALLHTQNDVVVFLDADMVVDRDFLATHLLRQEIIKNAVVVGLREDISLAAIRGRINLKSGRLKVWPDYRADFRYQKFVPKNWRSEFSWIPKKNFGKNYQLLKTTNYFKSFGLNKTIGVWQLPSMALSSNMSVRRKNLIKVGGFDTRFKGWGMEDTYLAAKLIATGAYIIPNLHLTAYHIASSLSKNQRSARQREFDANLKIYLHLQKERLPNWTEANWKIAIKRLIVNKERLIAYLPQ